MSNMNRASSPVEVTLLPLLASHLNHLSKDELMFRHNAIIGGLAGIVSSPIGMALAQGAPDTTSREFMISWVAGSLEGPATNR
jgi:hypothetical protein